MWDRVFRQRAYIGITRSCMRWYVRKKNLSLDKPCDAIRWSLGQSHDAKRWSSRQIFLSQPHTCDGFLDMYSQLYSDTRCHSLQLTFVSTKWWLLPDWAYVQARLSLHYLPIWYCAGPIIVVELKSPFHASHINLNVMKITFHILFIWFLLILIWRLWRHNLTNIAASIWEVLAT